MRLVDNRYKIERILESSLYFETYKVYDLWEDDRVQLMKVYHPDVQTELMSYFTDNYIKLSNIIHPYILKNQRFKLVKTVDTKKANMLLYYSISEYIHSPCLADIKNTLTLNERLKLILDTMIAIDFLHFKGFVYKLLNPLEIYITEDHSVKLSDLATIIEKEYHSSYEDLTRYFISPEALINKNDNDKRMDFYSLGVLIKYLLLEDFSTTDAKRFVYCDDQLDKNQEEVLNDIIKQLTKRDFLTRDVELLKIVEEINSAFNLGYTYDLIENRNYLSFNNVIIGREKEIETAMAIDENILKVTNEYKGLIVKGDFGVGKSRFLNEISHRLRLRGRDVYFIGINESENNDLLDMSNILKQSIKDTPTELMEKYREELGRILPELRLNIDDNIETNLNEKAERYRLYNRVANYFSELSKDKIIYLIIDDMQRCNSNFLTLLDYLIKNVRSNNIFFVFSYEKDYTGDFTIAEGMLKEWENVQYIQNIELHKLGLEENGEMVQNILGMSYIPHNLSSVLYRESQGNPRYLEYIMKHLFNIGELYMHSNGKWYRKGDSYDDWYFPLDFHDAFNKQLNIIKKDYFDTVKVMSVFNDALHKKILLNMLKIESSELEKELNELIGLKLIDEKFADWGYSYSINSSELKKLVYYEINGEEKNQLHKEAARAIQEFYGDAIEIVLEELTYHLIKSKDFRKALDITMESFDKLENKYSTHARLLLEKAYNIAKDIKDISKLNILEKLADIYSLKGETEKGNLYLEDYKREAEELNDLYHIIKVKSIFVDTYYRKGQSELENRYIEEIEKIIDTHDLGEGRIIALLCRSRQFIRNGELKKAEEFLTKAIELAKILQLDKYMGTLYNRLGLTHAFSGNVDKAVECYEKSILFHQKTDTMIDATRPINNIGTIYADSYFDSKKAMENYEKGLAIATKYGVQEVEIIFLNNIAELHIRNYEFDKALKNMEEVKKGAIELEDLQVILLANINMGTIYLSTSKFDKAYECYVYLKGMFENEQIADVEIKVAFNHFLSKFYGHMGIWGEASERSRMVGELCKEYSIREYLRNQCLMLYFKYLEDGCLNKNEMERVRESYRGKGFIQDRRKALLYFSTISILDGDIDYGLDLLEEDSGLIGLENDNFLDIFRNGIQLYVDSSEESIDDLITISEKIVDDDIFTIGLILNMGIGFKLYSKRQYKRSIKYFVDALDTLYRLSLTIPDMELKRRFIESRKGDLIKDKIISAIDEEYGYQIDFIKLKDVNEENIYDYFDITPMIDTLGNEEFARITQLEFYGEALNISSTEELISRLGDNYEYNLDLILSYLSKETFAKRGFILSINEADKEYEVISSLEKKHDYKINEGILKLVNRSKKGILINSNFKMIYDQKYREYLSDDIKGIICIPIIIYEESKTRIDRRKYSFDEGASKGYIYLETDSVFNRFDTERLNLIRKLIYLIFINLENKKLRFMATTDKLTGTFTRKYYESKFEQFVSSTKPNNGSFAILMLDIDKFKNVNDSYGHRKGDEVLAAIGGAIKSIIRSTDVVARYGGEEFIVLLKNTRDEALGVAEKIRKSIESLKIQGIDYSITSSIGVSIYPIHGQFKEELVEKADQALYNAKETGRNKVVLWNTQMDNTLNRVDKLAGIITGNLDEDNRNILALMDVIELIKEDSDIKEKTYAFLGRLLETIDAEVATLMIVENNEVTEQYFTRGRFDDHWVNKPSLNYKIIHRVVSSRKGEFLIDWDNIDNIDSLSGLPNWQSIIVLPLVRKDKVKGILYISTSLTNKEFDFNNFNLSKNFSNIFASIV